MSDQIFRPSPWKWIASAAVGLVAMTSGVVAVSRSSFDSLGRYNVGGIVVGVALITLAVFSSGRSLRISQSGLEVRERFRRNLSISWEVIEEIGIAWFPSSAGGHLSYQQFVGLRLRTDVDRPHTSETKHNRKSCGYDILLEPGYGLGLEELVAILQKEKAHATMG